MKTRIVETKFWKDTYIVNLTPQEKLIYLYLLTTEKVNIIHCYEVTNREIAFDTGIDTPIVEATKKKLEKDGKLAFYKGFVCLINAWKYESYNGPQNEKAKERLIFQLGDTVAQWYRGIYTPLIPPISNKSEIISNKSYIKDNNSEDMVGGYEDFQKKRKELFKFKK